NDTGRVEALARELGVEPAALLALGCCWAPRCHRDVYARYGLAGTDCWHSCWVFPMRSGDGAVVGLSRRFSDGRKLTARKREADPPCDGLYYPDDWNEMGGPVVVVEGPSDAAALLSCGIRAVGRPNNTGGGRHLRQLLAGLEDGAEVIVLGENDEKDSGL